MMRYTPLIFLAFILVDCAAQKQETYSYQADISKIVGSLHEGVMSKNIGLSDSVLSVNTINGTSWANLLDVEHLYFLKEIDATKESKPVDFITLFDDRELSFMKKQISSFNFKSWQTIININSQEQKFSKTMLHSTVPVFTRNRSYAIIYTEDDFSGNLQVFKRTNESWRLFATGTIWIE